MGTQFACSKQRTYPVLLFSRIRTRSLLQIPFSSNTTTLISGKNLTFVPVFGDFFVVLNNLAAKRFSSTTIRIRCTDDSGVGVRTLLASFYACSHLPACSRIHPDFQVASRPYHPHPRGSQRLSFGLWRKTSASGAKSAGSIRLPTYPPRRSLRWRSSTGYFTHGLIVRIRAQTRHSTRKTPRCICRHAPDERSVQLVCNDLRVDAKWTGSKAVVACRACVLFVVVMNIDIIHSFIRRTTHEQKLFIS